MHRLIAYFYMQLKTYKVSMRKTTTILAGLFLLTTCNSPQTGTSFEPVNKNASKEVHQLMDYLYTLSGEKTLSGQHNYSSQLTRSSDSVFAITGKHHVVWGSDFENKKKRPRMLEEAVDRYNEGYIITLMYHQGAPIDSIPHKITPYRYAMNEQEWSDLVTPGTETNQAWLQDIDQVAEGLKYLQEKGVPVLWRPYHEMNGCWFWWCDKRGENGIVKLWQLMYERFTDYHQLNNLVWVWNANAPRDWKDDEAYAYDLFYPGHEYVDVLATDIYKGDYIQSHHDQLLELGEGRLIALGECGILPSPEHLDSMNHFVWFMDWANFIFRANKREDVQKLYHSDRVLTLEEYKAFLINNP